MLKKFHKYQGAGNDFVMIDNYTERIADLTSEEIATICHRRFGIGADGLIIINKSESSDFNMKYYNSDGNEGSMCGNGGRCAVQFANDLNIIKSKTVFNAIDGQHEAEIIKPNFVSLKMNDVHELKQTKHGLFMDTGSPHVMIKTNDIDNLDVFNLGKTIRNSEAFAPSGTNVNFFEINDNKIIIRTFERGVENETLACGTGSVATAIAAFHQNLIAHQNNVHLIAKGGDLFVSFEGNNPFTNIWLKGPATKVFDGYDFIK
jgi:diaminopimelate epimerase